MKLQFLIPVAILLTHVHVSFAGCTKLQKKALRSTLASSARKLPETSSTVRFIDNFELYQSSVGVPIDFRYNETSMNQQYQSSPGCPQSVDGFPWVYYGSPPRCFLASFRGPCQNDERMTLQSNSLFGVCACRCFVEKAEYQLVLPETTDRYVACKINHDRLSLIYDKEGKNCYTQFQQGPCSSGKVIASWTGDSVACLPKCDFNDGKRIEMNKKGLCSAGLLPAKSAPSSLSPGTCADNERYSSLLRKCIYNHSLVRDSIIG